MSIIIKIFSIFIGFTVGGVVSGAIFSFIAMIGVVPRLAQKTKTSHYIKYYEEVIIFGGIWGATTLLINYSFNIWGIMAMFLALSSGVFLGCLAVSLTEVLDVIPILARRTKSADGLKIFMISIALGKFVGTIIYYLIDM